tara:strand:- start:354 stop:554 length:201 start_codon:yes stop_codon:yes gene_type:complete
MKFIILTEYGKIQPITYIRADRIEKLQVVHLSDDTLVTEINLSNIDLRVLETPEQIIELINQQEQS